ncbi:MAG: hypothetical protein DRI44_04105 [Chlamydiae bacterium]|nr:MAG: hypothetical protein DRI44_04105 [Chlamydiota bacterium]
MNSDKCIENILIIGGGMITNDLILPAVYHLQRLGKIKNISVCALNGRPLKELAENPTIKKAFPNSSFNALPDYNSVDLNESFPELYKDVLNKMEPENLVIVATPDQTHYKIAKDALAAGQHTITVKPLVLKHCEAVELENIAKEKGLFLGVEYHKRMDDRALMARHHYREGHFGEFRLGQASMIEPYYYMKSNFQNWCVCENTDMFSYVGCHYVDQIHFITGLLPVEISVYAIKDKYPNGQEGYLWTDARVLWNNGACLNVINAIGYPNIAPGGNAQGLKMFCKGEKDACMIFHEDQYRGVKYSFDPDRDNCPDKKYQEPSPDFMKLVYRGGNDGLEPVGYGYRSIEKLVQGALRVKQCESLTDKQKELNTIDEEGILATPQNSFYNELVMEAGRLSILNDGKPAVIEYGENPSVRLK